VSAEESAVHFDHSGQPALHLLSRHRLTQLVGQDEGRFVLSTKITAKLQNRDALDRVHENRGRGEVVADRQLAAGEDRPAGDAELVSALFAFPKTARGHGVDGCALATRAERLAAVIGKPDCLKASVCIVVRHPHDRAQRIGCEPLRKGENAEPCG